MRRGLHAAAVGLALGVVACAAVGCPSAGTFLCVDDTSCDRIATGGVCLADGDCAYPDGVCPSGLRRSPGANTGASECVPAELPGTSTTTATTTPSSDEDTVAATSSGDTATASSSGTIPTCGERKSLLIDTVQLPDGADPYPLLLAIDDPDVVAAGDEIWFADDRGQIVPHEIDAGPDDPATRMVWLGLSGYTVPDPVTVWVHYGDPASAPVVLGRDVWASHYLGVWHLGDPLSADEAEPVIDSTVNVTHGAALGGMGPEANVPGVVGGALLLDGDDDFIEVPTPWAGELTSFTVSVWARVDDNSVTPGSLFDRLNGDNLYPRCRKLPGEPTASLFCQVGTEETTVLSVSASGSLTPLGSPFLAALRWDGAAGEMTLFVDGQPIDTTDITGMTLRSGDREMRLGQVENFGGLVGWLDEFRLADVALSDAWLAADYFTQLSPTAAILDVGEAEPATCP